MKEFFGFGGYTRPIEGYMSWQHLLLVSILMSAMICFAIMLGIRNKDKSDSQKNKVLIFTAILIDSLELFKIVLLCFRCEDAMHWVYDLPLFLCSIQLIAIPIAAFSNGRLKESALDFVFVFGLLGAVFGTYFAGNNYSSYPVLSFDNVISGLTHSISGFAALYIGISRLASMKRKNMPLTFCILISFCLAASIANIFTDCNYMFLLRGDGTPYDICYNIVNGNPVLYALFVVGLFILYIAVFYLVYFYVQRKLQKAKKN